MLTDDPTNPKLHRGVDTEDTEQHEVYLVLSDEERAKGFVRPVRTSYRHVGIGPSNELRDLTPDEQERNAGSNYVAYESYGEDVENVVGRFWTQEQLDSGCGAVTTMGTALAETYARDNTFYGATYCVNCRRHLPVGEFVWIDDGTTVGS